MTLSKFGVLSNGLKVPVLGFGTWKAAPGVVGSSVVQAIKTGFRHIDCADRYENEHEIGDALQTVLKGTQKL
jgi:alcohol dehydrogenase (NADP+)